MYSHRSLLLLILISQTYAASVRQKSPSDAIICTTCVHGHRIGDPCLGLCVCNNKWEGKDCNSCANNTIGEQCQYSDALTCSNHGTVDTAGSCACFHGWAGDACNICARGFKGIACNYSNIKAACFLSDASVSRNGLLGE